MHINFALEVIATVRAESPELFDTDFEKQIVAMMEEAVDCETAFAEDFTRPGCGRPVAQGHARLSGIGCRPTITIVWNQKALRHA